MTRRMGNGRPRGIYVAAPRRTSRTASAKTRTTTTGRERTRAGRMKGGKKGSVKPQSLKWTAGLSKFDRTSPVESLESDFSNIRSVVPTAATAPSLQPPSTSCTYYAVPYAHPDPGTCLSCSFFRELPELELGVVVDTQNPKSSLFVSALAKPASLSFLLVHSLLQFTGHNRWILQATNDLRVQTRT